MQQAGSNTKQALLVIGANGGIGKATVIAALEAGHYVTAVLRTPSKLAITHPSLRIVQGDIIQPGALDTYLSGIDVVVSAIGSSSFKKTVLYSQGSRHVIDAMTKAGIKRAFFISASGLEVNPSHSLIVRLATRFILQQLLRNMYADLWRMEHLIKGSGIDWTIVRPPRLVDKPATGNYRMAIDTFSDRGMVISRSDVAGFVIDNLSNPAIIKRTVEVYEGKGTAA